MHTKGQQHQQQREQEKLEEQEEQHQQQREQEKLEEQEEQQREQEEVFPSHLDRLCRVRKRRNQLSPEVLHPELQKQIVSQMIKQLRSFHTNR